MLAPGQAPATRRPTRQIVVGDVAVGGSAPVSVQSMTTTRTADVEATLRQVYALAGAGADIVRCTCNDEPAAAGLAHIVPRSPVPIVADIHHQHRLALAALDAGVHGLRLNPGNIRKPEHIKAVAAEARDCGMPIRIGVNAGSLDPRLYRAHGGVTPEAMVASALSELAMFEEVGFSAVKVSVKASTPSRRPGPAGNCSRRWACATAATSTSSPARAVGGPRSTSSRWPVRPWPPSPTARYPCRWR